MPRASGPAAQTVAERLVLRFVAERSQNTGGGVPATAPAVADVLNGAGVDREAAVGDVDPVGVPGVGVRGHGVGSARHETAALLAGIAVAVAVVIAAF